MGLTSKDLEAKPELVDLIVAYHFIPGYQATAADVAKGSKIAATGDDNYIVTLDKGPLGHLRVQDVQGNKANVLAKPVTVGKINVFVIDKVLLSGGYFTDTLSALKHYPSWITTYGLITQTGVDKDLAAATGGYTLFVPSVKAWKPVEPAVSLMSNGVIAQVLKYHVVLGARQIPREFKDGPLPTLFLSHDVVITVDPKRTELNPYTRKMQLQPLVQITSEVNKTAAVQTYNIYAGRNMLHGIDRVLSPILVRPQAAAGTIATPAAVATAPAGPNKVTTEVAVSTNKPTTTSTTNTNSTPAAAVSPPASGATNTTRTATVTPATGRPNSPSGRRLLHVTMMLQPIKALEIGTTQTDAAGIAVGKTLAAITAAAGSEMPVQYRNRFGSFGVGGEANACLNCEEWVKGR
eukprot:GHUV01002512.1.p1 GENE.GHUV01002512.1~~GHUV01002512.1.p1  ORF type:complete len:407 (+),score=108.71 GHUV01002512.1:415-1635(+)